MSSILRRIQMVSQSDLQRGAGSNAIRVTGKLPTGEQSASALFAVKFITEFRTTYEERGGVGVLTGEYTQVYVNKHESVSDTGTRGFSIVPLSKK